MIGNGISSVIMENNMNMVNILISCGVPIGFRKFLCDI